MIMDHKDGQADAAPKKRGRPAKAETDRKNTYLGFRVRDGMREKLTAAADAAGRSPSEEIERRLVKSFEDEQRIAELERHIDVMKQTEHLLWPDESARVMGKAFAMALTAARHISGQDWREDPAASIVLAGTVRRLMERYSRTGTMGAMVAGLFDKAHLAATADSIVQTMADHFDEAMPPLPPLQPQNDPANWTDRAHLAVTFRDKATGKLLQLVRGPDFDTADPEAVRDLGPDYGGAVDRFAPIRDTVNAESFMVLVLKDGSSAWESLDRKGRKVHVPAGQDAPSIEEPATRLEGQPEATRLMANTKPAPGQDSSIFDRAVFDDAVAGLPMIQAERAAPVEDAAEHATAPAPKRRTKAKA